MVQLPLSEHPGECDFHATTAWQKLFSFLLGAHTNGSAAKKRFAGSGEQAPDHNHQHENHKQQQQAQTQQLEYAQCAFLAAGCG